MKRLFFILVICLMTTFVFAEEEYYKQGQTLYVSVKSAKLGKNVVEYGDVLIVDEMAGKKVLVHLKDKETIYGLIPVTSITKKKIIKNNSGSKVRATTDELSLAGKGFSETSENIFESENPEMNFKLVDAIEKIGVSQNDLDSFILEGGLCDR